MVFESFDSSTGEDLILSEFHMLKKAKLSLPSGSLNLDHLDYDERIQLFQHISKSLLFSYKPIKLSDLLYWFPECQQSVIPSDLSLSQDAIMANLEVILAEIMEGNMNLSHFIE